MTADEVFEMVGRDASEAGWQMRDAEYVNLGEPDEAFFSFVLQRNGRARRVQFDAEVFADGRPSVARADIVRMEIDALDATRRGVLG